MMFLLFEYKHISIFNIKDKMLTSYQKQILIARIKNGLYLWCGQVEARFLEQVIWIVVLKCYESRAYTTHSQEIGWMCHYFRRKG